MTEINLPPALAARRAALISAAQCARDEADEHAALSEERSEAAARCQAEIAGIDAAAEAFAELLAQAIGERIAREEHPASATEERRERRDIRAIILDAIVRAMPRGATEDELTARFSDMRRGQIANAIAHHEAVGRIRKYLPTGYWRIVPEPATSGPATADDLALGSA